MALTASDLKPIEKALLNMNTQLKNYQEAILKATEATEDFVKKEKEALKQTKEVNQVLKVLDGSYNESKDQFEIRGKKVDEFGRRLNKVGDVITSFNKRTSILGLSIKELQDQGKSFEIFSKQTLDEYRRQGGNILEFIAEGISGTREEITLFGMEGAKFRRILYGFFPPGAFRLINKAATVFQFFGSAVRRSTDSGKEHQKTLEKLREERKKLEAEGKDTTEIERALAAHSEGGQGRMGLTEMLFKGIKKIPAFSLKGNIVNPLEERAKELGFANAADVRAKAGAFISGQRLSRDEMIDLRTGGALTGRNLRTVRGTFGRRLPANLQAQLDTGLKDPSQLDNVKNARKLIKQFSKINLAVSFVAQKPKELFGKFFKGFEKAADFIFVKPFTALKAISRFTIMMTGYILYYGIIISALIIALRKPIMAGLKAFYEYFKIFKPIILFALDTIWGGIKDIYNGFKNGDLFLIIEGILEIAFGLLLGLWAIALGLWAGFLGFIGEFINNLFTNAKNYFVSFMDGLGANFETVKKAIVILTAIGAVIFGWPAIVAGISVAVVAMIIKKGGDIFDTISGKLGKVIEDAFRKGRSIAAKLGTQQGRISLIAERFGKNTAPVPASIPAMANGGISAGGLTLVGERGPEIVNLPRGARVNSNADSRKMMGHTFNITINARDSSKAEMRRMAEEIGRMINSKINRSTSLSTFR